MDADAVSESETSDWHRLENEKQAAEISAIVSPNARKIDRERVTPMFLKMYCRIGGHHRIEEFAAGMPSDDELIVYTWKDATLKELTGLIKEVHEDSRHPQTRFSFRLIIQEMGRGGRFTGRDLGIVANSRPGKDDGRTLEEVRFIQGDYLDVAIYLGGNNSAASNGAGSE